MKARTLRLISTALFLSFALLASSQKAEATAMEQKFGVSDGSILVILIGIAILFTILILAVNDSIKNLAGSHKLWKNRNVDKVPSILVILGTLCAPDLAAQAYPEVKSSAFVLDETTFWFLVAADLFLFAVAMYYIAMLKRITRAIRGEVDTETPFVERPSWVSQILNRMTGAVPLERETDVLTNHEYDGIHELDNNLPPWWKWLFYLSIAWGFAYLLYYHVFQSQWSSGQEYLDEVAAADAEVQHYLVSRALNVDENSVQLVTEKDQLDKGGIIFKKNCVACHGQLGEGGQGPNLTDPYWIHGGSINAIFSTIKYGVPQKGMIPWKDQLTAVDIQNVTSYIAGLFGTNPPNAKEAQGKLYEPSPGEAVPGPAPSDTIPASAEQSPAPAVSQISN